MVRPMANSPPNRFRYGNPTTSRSAPRFDRLVDDGRADVAGLEQHGLEADLVFLGDRLRAVEDALDLVGVARDVRVERQRPVDLEDVDGDDLSLGVARLVRHEADDPVVARAAVQGDDGTAKRRRLGF